MKKILFLFFLLSLFSCRIYITSIIAQSPGNTSAHQDDNGGSSQSQPSEGGSSSGSGSTTNPSSGAYGSVMEITTDDDFRSKVMDVSQTSNYNYETYRYDCELNSTADGIIVVDFYKIDCGNCSAIAGIFEELAPNYKNVKFYKVLTFDRFSKRKNENGQYLDRNGNVVEDYSQAETIFYGDPTVRAAVIATDYLEKEIITDGGMSPYTCIIKNGKIVWGYSGWSNTIKNDIEKRIK